MNGQEELLSRLLETTQQLKEALAQDYNLFLQLQNVRNDLFSQLNMSPKSVNEEELTLIHEITNLDSEIIQALRDSAAHLAHDIIQIGHALNNLRSHSPQPSKSYIDVKR